MKFQNTFISGRVDKDTDERLTPSDVLIDAENALVTTAEGSSRGVMKNVLGNVRKTFLNPVGGKTIGKGTCPSEEKVYYLVAGTLFDYLLEWHMTTNVLTVVLQSTAGTGVLNLNRNKRVLNFNVIIDPEGNGNLAAWSGDDNPPRIVNIERAKTYPVDGFTEQEISVVKSPYPYPLILTPFNSGDNDQTNNLADRFPSFCIQYRYQDGFYSAFSTWTEYFFYPGVLNIDFDTFENFGMLNIYDSVNIGFDTGGRDVVGVDVIFKLSNSSVPYLIESFNKEDEGWGDNTTQFVIYNNSKSYRPLPESQYFRNYDNVPRQAFAQTVAGNRLFYANYLEQYNLIDKNGDKVIMDYILELVANNISTVELEPANQTVNYTYGGIPVTLPNGQMIVDFSAVNFVQGSSINIYFKLKSNVQPTDFRDTYIYILTADYIDFNDFITNSGFIADLQAYIGYFVSNGGVVFPNDYVPPYTIEQGFVVTSSGTSITVKFPVIKYEIDQAPDPNTFLYEYFYDNNTIVIISNIAVASSLKSYRSYEVGMIYRDEYCRKTTVLTSQFNTLNIPNSNCVTQNQIKVVIPPTQLPPTWAKTYKFCLKVNKQPYQTIAINIYFIDGIFRWIKIDGVNRGKIKEDDILIVKRDKNGALTDPVKVKVLELASKPSNFLTLNSSAIIEPEGLYAKIKASNFQMQYDDNEFIRYEKHRATEVGAPKASLGNFTVVDPVTNTIIDRQINQGSTVTFNFSSNYHQDPPFIEFVRTYTAQRTYDNFKQFWDNQIAPDGFESTNSPLRFYNIQLIRGFETWAIYPNQGGTITAINDNQLTLSSPNALALGVENRRVFVESPTPGFFYLIGTVIGYDPILSVLVLDLVQNVNIGQVIYVSSGPAVQIGVDADPDGFLYVVVEGTESGQQSGGPFNGKRAFLDAIIDIRYVSGLYVFETIPLDADDSLFFETPEVYDVVDGNHQMQDHILTKAYNCYCQGNGIESYQIRDAFNEKYLGIDFCPTAVSEDDYREIRRYADITYSGTYDSTTNVNKLNEFNLSLGNYNDKIEKSYGPILKINAHETDLEVIQEDKHSIVYYGKDLLSNTDGTTNLIRIEEVLGQQNTLNGEFGISNCPDSYDFYGFDRYAADPKRGVVLKKSNNGLFAISSQGMEDYFKDLFRNNRILQINGKYDQYTNFYYLNVQYVNSDEEERYVTWLYSDKDNGWMGRLTFNPEDMVRLNNDFVSFKDGELYLHNQPVYNTFYGVYTDSSFAFNFSQEPSMRKLFKTIEIEGSTAAEITLKTDYNDGYINLSDFAKKEGVFYAYVKLLNDAVDTSLLSCQGIGNATIVGVDTLQFGVQLDSVYSIGDFVLNSTLQIVGTIVDKTPTALILDAIANISSGDYVLCAKNQSAENNSLLGYYMRVGVTFGGNEYKEIFAINTLTTKSYS